MSSKLGEWVWVVEIWLCRDPQSVAVGKGNGIGECKGWQGHVKKYDMDEETKRRKKCTHTK